MVAVRASRLALEVAADEGTVGDITRLDVQVAGLSDTATRVRASRMAIEVVGQSASLGSVTRLDVQVAGLSDAATQVLASRMAIEVAASSTPSGSVTRLDVQVAGLSDTPTTVLASRMAIEVVAREGSAGPVTPIALIDDVAILLHNWAEGLTLRSSFLTDIAASPSTGAEGRRGLVLKPQRSMDVEWMICDGTGDLERFETFLRRITDGPFSIPLYCDQRIVETDHLSTDTVIALDTRRGRFFTGQRLAFAFMNPSLSTVESVVFRTIVSMTNASVTLSSAVGVAVPAGTLVLPMMDVQAATEVEVEYITAKTGTVSLTVVELPGASQLPSTKTDFPTGSFRYGGKPIWSMDPDWSEPVKKGRTRANTVSDGGRRSQVILEESRSRQTHQFMVSGTRDDTWGAVEFFETRRGALRSFWHIDHDQYLEIAAVDASGNFISVSDNGQFDDFSEELDYIGLVLADGTVYVRGVVTVQEVLTVFRMTVDTPLPAGISVNDVVRVARARPTRFMKDELIEEWASDGFLKVDISLIETLDENAYASF